MAGAMQRAWLAAYRRTLEKTMEQARSMDQVVKDSGLDWLETPDQAARLVRRARAHRSSPGRPRPNHGRLGGDRQPRPASCRSGIEAGAGSGFERRRRGWRRRRALLVIGRARTSAGCSPPSEPSAALPARPVRRRRLRRRRVRWRRRRRRRLLAVRPTGARGDRGSSPVHCRHGCSRHDGSLLRETQRR